MLQLTSYLISSKPYFPPPRLLGPSMLSFIGTVTSLIRHLVGNAIWDPFASPLLTEDSRQVCPVSPTATQGVPQNAQRAGLPLGALCRYF